MTSVSRCPSLVEIVSIKGHVTPLSAILLSRWTLIIIFIFNVRWIFRLVLDSTSGALISISFLFLLILILIVVVGVIISFIFSVSIVALVILLINLAAIVIIFVAVALFQYALNHALPIRAFGSIPSS